MAGRGNRQLPSVTVVPRGLGRRLGIDRDLDGELDRDELVAGTDAAERQLLPEVVTPLQEMPVGMRLQLDSVIPPWPAPGWIKWWKDGQPLVGATNASLSLGLVTEAGNGPWHRAADVVAQPMDRLVSVTNILDGSAERYFRLGTPRPP